MIQTETFLNLADNSGCLLAKCLHVYNKNVGLIGDKVLISVQKIKRNKVFTSKNLIKTHFLYKGIVINSRVKIIRWDGKRLKFSQNSIALLSLAKETLIGTRIIKPILLEFRTKKFLKILLISNFLV